MSATRPRRPCSAPGPRWHWVRRQHPRALRLVPPRGLLPRPWPLPRRAERACPVQASRPAARRRRTEREVRVVSSSGGSLDGARTGLAGSYAHDLLQIEDKNFAVPDLAGIGRFLDRFYHLVPAP